MSFLQAAGLAVRLFAIWLFLFALQAGAALLAMRRSGNFEPYQIMYLLVPSLVAVVLGVLFWRFPLAVSRFFVPRTSDSAPAISLAECWKLGSVMIGLLIFAQAGPVFLRCLVVMLYYSRQDVEALPVDQQGMFAEALGKIIVAFVLIFKSNMIHKRLGGARTE